MAYSAVEHNAAWLRAQRTRLGWSATEIADRTRAIAEEHGENLKLPQQLISKFENGGLKSTPNWLGYVQIAVARHLKAHNLLAEDVWALDLPAATQRYIADRVGGIGSVVTTQNSPDSLEAPATVDQGDAHLSPAEMGLVKITEIDLDIGMGAAFMDEPEVTEVDRWIPQEWVSNFTSTPAALLAIARPTGDSMYPTINDRDLVLIDRSERTIQQQDAIWVLVYGGLSTIKRVRMRPDGTARLMADNPQVRDEVATDGELFVIGRVAGVFRRT